MIAIPHRWRLEPAYTSEAATDVRSAALEAVAKQAYLRGADLRGAYLSGAYLSGAYLSGAYLSGADLSGAYLSGAYLSGADLRGADLRGAYLRGADLRGADLSGAYLRGADLRGADLRGADLRGAYLSGADLSGAYLRGADLSGAKLAWQSHDLVAELLARAVPTPGSAADLRPVHLRRHALIGLILANRAWCWADFARIPLSKGTRRWALKALAAYKVDGDDAPALIARAAAKIKARTPQVAASGHPPENGAEGVDPPPPG